MLLCLALLSGCEPADDPAAPQAPAPANPQGGGGDGAEGGGGDGAEGGGNPAPGCEEGDTRDCTVQLGTHEGVTSCFKGVQTCQNATWGPCGEPPPDDDEFVPPPAPLPGDLQGSGAQVPLAGAAAIPCFDNPCDPSCRQFPNAPPGGIGADEKGASFDWRSGSIDDLPSTVLQKAVKEPCDEGSDCQIDQVCVNPASGTCAHSKCETGGALSPSCDPCVASVCAAQPSCCPTVIGPACSHNLCSTGSYVKASCDPCAAAVCSDPLYALCCSIIGGWSSACVARMATKCGKTCSAGSWTQSCVDKVTTVCGALCPAEGCGNDCPEEGQCEPWGLEETYPSCSGIDLTAGAVCGDQGVTVLPVCNRGQATAPAGIPIAVYAGNAGKIPSSNPGGTGAQYCSTNKPIPAGHCIEVTCGAVTANKEIMVNPPGLAGSVAECHSNNNWTISPATPGACEAPSCAGSSVKGTLKKVNLFFAIDRSASMLEKSWGLPGQPTRWKQLTDALTSFVSDPKSAGIGVWVRFWPYDVNGSCPSPSYGCSATACATPNVPLKDLTANAAPADTQEAAVLAAIAAAAPTLGTTPLHPALSGALSAATSYQAAHPKEIAVVVLVTDGEPTQCTTSTSEIAALSHNSYSNHGVRTHVIGIAGVSGATISAIAAAGGGQSFLVGSGASVPVAAQVLEALQAIRGEAVACSFPLPEPGTFDAAGMKVTLALGGGAAQAVPRVTGPSACGAGGWYYDDPASPVELHLCPSTCQIARNDPAAEVTMDAPCPGAFLPRTVEEVYEATCPHGTHPRWGYLTYGTTTPSDSRVEFRVAASDTGSFASAPEHLVATARTSTGTSSCGIGGPAPCPLDLAATLGKPKSGYRYLRLRADLIPSIGGSQGPTLNQWKITYSCPDAE